MGESGTARKGKYSEDVGPRRLEKLSVKWRRYIRGDGMRK